MQPATSARPSYPLAPEWQPSDFVWPIVGGFVGAFVGAALAFDAAPLTLLIVSLALQNAGHLLAVWAVARRRNTTLTRIGLEIEPSDGIFLFLGAGLQIALSLLIVPIVERLEFEGSAQEITDSISPDASAAAQIILVLLVGLVAPVTEELMFRGVLYQLLEQRRSFRVAVFGSSLVFSSFHIIGLSTENFLLAALITLPQLFIVGAVLANTSRRRGRLGPAVFIHAGFNLVAILAVLFTPELVGS
ncbi:MAG: CPBP family intramembrane metalloprotease [Acidimicrobiia bacterium]|nr:CPBP family intramembrane metalloprotease [Acidimicrobiia bacterium]